MVQTSHCNNPPLPQFSTASDAVRFKIGKLPSAPLFRPRCYPTIKVVFILVLSALAVTRSVAQDGGFIENGYNKSRVGVRAGIVFTNIKTQSEPGIDYRSLTRVRAGLFAHIPLDSKTYFRPELALTGKGAEYETGYVTSILFTYLEMPLNVVYKVASSKGILLLGGGPAPAFLLNQDSYSFYGPNSIKKFDLGINALATYERPLGFSFNIHYTHGLLNISADEASRPLIKNRCFGISLGFLF